MTSRFNSDLVGRQQGRTFHPYKIFAGNNKQCVINRNIRDQAKNLSSQKPFKNFVEKSQRKSKILSKRRKNSHTYSKCLDPPVSTGNYLVINKVLMFTLWNALYETKRIAFQNFCFFFFDYFCNSNLQITKQRYSTIEEDLVFIYILRLYSASQK